MVAASGPGAAALQLVVSCSLRRTLRTAVEPFAGLGVPFVALDQLREVAGAFDCERRRPLAEIATEFPLQRVGADRGRSAAVPCRLNLGSLVLGDRRRHALAWRPARPAGEHARHYY